jgi:hypothetical protein
MPFETDASYLSRLPDQLDAFVRNNVGRENTAQQHRRIVFPTWVKGIAAALILIVSSYAAQLWLRPTDPDRKLAKELRKVDATSIEAYLEQGGIDATRYSTRPEIPDETAQAISDLEPADIREYLNQNPAKETE